MAVTTTPRLGLNRWSAGTDLHPNRAEWDAQQAILEDKIAIDVEVETYADRPDPKRGIYMWVLDEQRLYRATSTGWATTAKIGGGGRGTQIVVGPASSAVEGVSSHGARADHTHTIPLVTASADGAMAKADKVKLDAATDAATASTLARRNSTGGIKFSGVELTAAPSAPSDAIRKTDLDALSTAAVQYKTTTSAKAANLATPGDYRITDEPGAFISIRPLNDTGSDVLRVRVDGTNPRAVASRSTDGGLTWKTAGTLIASTDMATSAADGLMAKADKSKLDAATSSETASTLMSRDSSGRTRAANPVAAQDVATKAYTDAKAMSEATAAVAAIPLVTASVDGLMRKVDKAKLDAAVSTAVANTLMLRDSSGRARATSPLNNDDVSNKAYTDSTAASAAASAVGAIPNATSARDGLMPKADKALLDNATSGPYANRIVQRDVSGRARFASPSAGEDAANKSYVDGETAKRLPFGLSAGTDSLDGLLAPGQYEQPSSSPVSTSNGYPINGSAGTVNVEKFGSRSWVIQRYIEWSSRRVFFRATNGGESSWSEWREMAGTETATSSKDGLMSRSDKSLLDTATYSAQSSVLVQRYSNSQIGVPTTPTADYHAASKAYADGLAAKQVQSVNGSLGDTDLDTLKTTGWYRQGASASATAARNYPDGGTVAGWLQVFTDVNMTWQVYLPYGNYNDDMFIRGFYSSTWHSWKRFTAKTATSSADGLMSKADKKKLDEATASAVGHALVKRYGSGQIGVPSVPDSANVAASKSYVDNAVEAAAEKDTGWRDVTSYATNLASGATVKARRKGDEVTFLVNGNLNWPSSNGSSYGRRSVDIISSFTSIAGFNGSQDGGNLVPLVADAELYANGRTSYNRASLSILSGVGGQLPKSGSQYLTFSLTRITKEDFPTTLPGTPTNL